MTGDSEIDPATRRIMHQLGEARRIPYLNVEEGDVGVLLGFPIGGLFLAGLFDSEGLALPLMLGGLALGGAVIVVTPSHQNAWSWLTTLARYGKRPRVTRHAAFDAEVASRTDSETGWRRVVPVTVDEQTQDLVNVERAWPGAGAIERPDGTMEAYLELSPDNMDFAMADDWAALQRAGEEFANTELEWPLKFHATTRSFPVDRLTRQLDRRLDDEDVAQNPIFQSLLDEYRETRPRDMRERGIQEMRYYLGVSVHRRDVYTRYQDAATPIEKLAGVPIVGVVFRPFITRREDFSEAELRAELFEKLDERIETVRAELIHQMPGWSARRLDTVELFVRTLEFWSGEEHDAEAVADRIRTQPVATREGRDD